jgi:hypothetical protein
MSLLHMFEHKNPTHTQRTPHSPSPALYPLGAHLQAGGGLVLLDAGGDIKGHAAPAVAVGQLGAPLRDETRDGVLMLPAIVVQGGHDGDLKRQVVGRARVTW